ncbi:hypothetical protein Q1Z72_01525 [Pseudomonas qingdaonensis]|uniref:hypothetical protein n=1 Tax=Pseudomonas qingdaonensis TaxID=2056231 RepID=UPI0021187C3E|nr:MULTISPECIES: hypothetical protein [Pseudomonas]WKL67375.1 hypothetical protein Q1Z72_01525 [Pseudomonas qingdaonensis]
MSSPEFIALEALQALLRGMEGDLPADALASVQITRSRLDGASSDFARGLVVIELPSQYGTLVVRSGWEARRQPLPAHDWYVLPVADAKGEGVSTTLPVFDEDALCPAAGDELAQLAWDFCSYLDLPPLVLPHLPKAPA